MKKYQWAGLVCLLPFLSETNFQSMGQFSQSSPSKNSNPKNAEIDTGANLTIAGLNAMQIMRERQSKKIKELKKEVNAVRLKGRS